MPEKKKAQKKDHIILVIGDWFIDENWLVAKHNTYTSTHTGDVHYLIKHEKIGKRMTSLCGVPEILEALRSNLGKNYSFIGVGVWNIYDSDILRCILCPDEDGKRKQRLELMTPYTIKGLKEVTSNECPYTKSRCEYQPLLVNLASKEIGQECSTNHIIRIFEGYGGGQPHIASRIDWEIPSANLDYKDLEKTIRRKNIVGVVIEDHNKGTVTMATITKIIETLGEERIRKIKWYIRSKLDNPPWLEKLTKTLRNMSKRRNTKIRLRVVDNKLAMHKKGPRKWRYGMELGRASLEILGELTGDQMYKHGEPVNGKNLHTERIAILLDDNTVISKDKESCFNISDTYGPKQLINIGRTTRFFSDLIYQDIMNNYKGDFYTECYNALHCAFEWSRTASQAWNNEKLFFWGDFKA